MGKSNKFVMITSGFPLYFFSIMIISFTLAEIFSIRELISNGPGHKDFVILGIGCLLVYPWGIIYFFFYLLSNRIEVTENKINISFHDRSKIRRSLKLPKPIKYNIDFKDIESILIGEGRFLKSSEKNKKTTMLSPVHPWLGAKFSPLMRIVLEDGKDVMVDIIPFSKKNITKLMKILTEKGLPVKFIQKNKSTV